MRFNLFISTQCDENSGNIGHPVIQKYNMKYVSLYESMIGCNFLAFFSRLGTRGRRRKESDDGQWREDQGN